MDGKTKKMKACSVCGNEIAKTAKVCPHCGAKNKNKILRRVILVIFIILCALWLRGNHLLNEPIMVNGEFNVDIINFASRYEDKIRENAPSDLGNITIKDEIVDGVMQYEILSDNNKTGLSFIFGKDGMTVDNLEEFDTIILTCENYKRNSLDVYAIPSLMQLTNPATTYIDAAKDVKEMAEDVGDLNGEVVVGDDANGLAVTREMGDITYKYIQLGSGKIIFVASTHMENFF